jgi:hypothetical protein
LNSKTIVLSKNSERRISLLAAPSGRMARFNLFIGRLRAAEHRSPVTRY